MIVNIHVVQLMGSGSLGTGVRKLDTRFPYPGKPQQAGFQLICSQCAGFHSQETNRMMHFMLYSICLAHSILGGCTEANLANIALLNGAKTEEVDRYNLNSHFYCNLERMYSLHLCSCCSLDPNLILRQLPMFPPGN